MNDITGTWYQALIRTMIITTGILSFAYGTKTSAAVIRVPSEFPTIQEGVDAAAEGDTILIADGTYTGDGNRDITINANELMVISENGPEFCVIDCEGTPDNLHRGIVILYNRLSTIIIDGLTIRNGFASHGGGIYLGRGMIRNCHIVDCTATEKGGGLYNSQFGMQIEDCTISGNVSGRGGGIYSGRATQIIRCKIHHNSAEYGGGILGPGIVIDACEIKDNDANNGGGAYCWDNVTIRDSIFTTNTGEDGGGLRLSGDDNLLINSAFIGNKAINGGGLKLSYSNCLITDCEFIGNMSEKFGGAINVSTDEGSKIQGCVFSQNSSETGGGISVTSPGLVIGGEPGKGNVFTGNRAAIGADIGTGDGAKLINSTYNSFAGDFRSDYSVSPQLFFNLDFCESLHAPIDEDVYVSPLGSDQNSGLSPDTPFRTIHYAFSRVAPNPENPVTIHLLPGTYSPSLTGEFFPLPSINGIHLSGSGIDTTILDAELSGRIITAFWDPEVTVSDLHLTQGFVPYDQYLNSIRGGGVYIRNSVLTFNRCRISRCISGFAGGALAVYRGFCTLNQCRVTGNSALEFAGGILNLESTLTMDGCEISGNSAGNDGGGGEFHENLTMVNCVITENVAGRIGGGAYIARVDHGIIENNTIVNNSAGEYGGGLHIRDSIAAVRNCIVRGNLAPLGSEICVSSNLDYKYVVNVEYSNIQGKQSGVYVDNAVFRWGQGNIDQDPHFTTSQTLPYALSERSPCIDAGSDNNIPATDFQGGNRVLGGAVDMGAFEYNGWPAESRAYVGMPSHWYRSGDPCRLDVKFWNAESTQLTDHRLYVLLDVLGVWFWGPGFGKQTDFLTLNLAPGVTEINMIPDFTWPDTPEMAMGITIYAAIMDPGGSRVIGVPGTFVFGWEPSLTLLPNQKESQYRY